jgi:hypothetical protein
MKIPLLEKVKLDLALSMTELSRATGYRRQVLAKMNLPWQAGKLSLGDFRRILRKRQDLHERNVAALAADSSSPTSSSSKSSPEATVTDHPLLQLVDKFDAPSRTRAKPTASHPTAESQLHGTAR